MKILFFIDGLKAGGKERRLVELIKSLAQVHGLDMELALTKEEIHYKDILSTNIKIHYLLRGELKKDPKIFVSFFKVAKEFSPDVIHVWSNLVALYAIPAKVLLGIPMINNQIGDVPLKMPSGLLNRHLTFPFSDLIVSNSQAGLKAYKAPAHKSRVIYNGFDQKRLANLIEPNIVKKKYGITSSKIVGMVASFGPLKDYRTYLEASQQVLRKFSDVIFLCIGSGDDREFRNMVDPEFQENILFLGKVDDVENVMNICDIGVLSTYTEGLSNALLEFCALGKPVISVDSGGNKELIDNGKTGILIPVQDPSRLAEELLYLLNNPEYALEMGRRAKLRVESKFSIKEMKDNFLELYHNFS